jgi:hypothetical protein
MASLEEPPPEQNRFLQALSRDPAETSRFLGVMEGTGPIHEFFHPPNLSRITADINRLDDTNLIPDVY